MTSEPTLPQGLSRETRIRRDAAGRWFDGDDRIDHPGVVSAFNRWLDRAEDGRTCLRNSIHWVYVSVEGPAVFVEDAILNEDGIELLLSTERRERLDVRTLRQDANGALFCSVHAGAFEARFTSRALAAIADSLVDAEGGVALVVSGHPHSIPVLLASDEAGG